MSQPIKTPFPGDVGKVFGFILIALGMVFLVGQWFHFDVGEWGWPFFIIIPGAVLLLIGIAGDDHVSQPLLILGSVVSAVGVLLFLQNLTGLWASWAYGWALVGPMAVGIGQMLYGTVKHHPEAVRAGSRLAAIGLALFVAGLIFFELIIGISGFGLGSWIWPILLIGLGVFLIARNILR